MAKLRVIIDTNLWISFLLTNDYAKAGRFFLNDELTLLFSQELLDEFITVAERPKFQKYFPSIALQALLLQLSAKATFIEVHSSVKICRDPKDNFLLALAQDGAATHLITGDKDLLVLEQFGETRILTMTEFLTED